MAKPPHVDQGRIDDAYVTALVALKQPVNTGRIVKATETIEEALAERSYFCEPANMRNIGRLAALHYAWRNEGVFRMCTSTFSILCAALSAVALLAQPWRTGVPHAMQTLGMAAFYPAMFGAIWFRNARHGLAYEFRAAPLLLAAAAVLTTLGLLGTWLA